MGDIRLWRRGIFNVQWKCTAFSLLSVFRKEH